MPSQFREPTRRERAEMERACLAFPCLMGAHEPSCGGTFIRDLQSDTWEFCTCSCHRERRKREGMPEQQRAVVRGMPSMPEGVYVPERHHGAVVVRRAERPTRLKDRW